MTVSNPIYLWQHGGCEFEVKIVNKNNADKYTLKINKDYVNKGGHLVFFKGEIVKQQNPILQKLNNLK